MARVYDMTKGMIHSDASHGYPDDRQADEHTPLIPDGPLPALQEFVPDPPTRDTTAIHHIRELLKRG
jgi:hypothetical protein